jgi:predicted Fe-Mo cluster-binding NifX family protein
MKIAVSATGGALNAQVEERFARAPYFVIVDSATMRFGLVSNPNVSARHSAGPEAARLIHQRGAEVVLTGRVGPKARRALAEQGVAVVEGASGMARHAVEAYLARL